MVAGEGLKNPRTVKNTVSKRSDKEIKFGEILPVDLRDWDGDTLYVRNNTNEVMSFDDKKEHLLTLRGVHTDEYISTLEIEIARNPGFQRFWREGSVTVSTDPAIEEELWDAEKREATLRKAELAKLRAGFKPVGDGLIYDAKATDVGKFEDWVVPAVE